MSSAASHDDQPLGMTVHTMPQPQEIAAAAGDRTRSGRWKMLLVLLVCLAPVLASYFTFYVVRPEGRRNFGELIVPQRVLPDLMGTRLDGRPVALRTLKDQWLLVSVAPAACDQQCARHLYFQRQLREGLGKEKQRLDWVWLVSDAAPVTDSLRPALSDATVIRIDAKELATWLEPEAGKTLQDHLYVVDPQGKWMMRFPPHLDEQSAVKVRRDLDRLLRASVHWDKAGR